MKKIISAILCVLLAFGFVQAEDGVNDEISIPERAVSGVSVKCDTEIELNGNEARIGGAGAVCEDGVLTISEKGSYLLSGDFEGTVKVNVEKDKKIELVLNGVHISGNINVSSAPKNVTFTTCEGSVNIIMDTSEQAEQGAPDAAVYSKEDLRFGGNGELYIVSENNRGIHSSDDIEINGGKLFVISAGNGIHGKDSVLITEGYVYVRSSCDGIKATNSETEGKGYVSITGGTVLVISDGDGIQAAGDVSISGGDVTLTCGGGYTKSTKKAADERGFGGKGAGKGGWGAPSFGGMAESIVTSEDETSAKGVKAGNALEVSGGNLLIDTAQDALHSDNTLTVSGGDILIYAGDDGLHADNVLNVEGGSINIETSYEGLEGETINISNGAIWITATDDGINAAGKTDGETLTAQNGMKGGRGGFGMGGNGKGELNISGGYIVVNACGDGIDSNNMGSMSSGTLIVYGPVENMNSAIDYERSFSYTGGTVIACGSAGMAQSLSASENGGVIAFTVSMTADTLMTITDESGTEVLAFMSPKSYTCVVFASEKLISGQTYSVYAGGTNSGNAVDGIYSGGVTTQAQLLGSLQAK